MIAILASRRRILIEFCLCQQIYQVAQTSLGSNVAQLERNITPLIYSFVFSKKKNVGAGADFQKNFENFVSFSDFPKALKRPCFGQILCAASKILRKKDQKILFRHFLENVDQKIAFFRRALPIKISIYWHQRRL